MEHVVDLLRDLLRVSDLALPFVAVAAIFQVRLRELLALRVVRLRDR